MDSFREYLTLYGVVKDAMFMANVSGNVLDRLLALANEMELLHNDASATEPAQKT